MNPRSNPLQRIAHAIALPALLGVSGLHSGCTAPQAMVSATSVPASQGTVTITDGTNGNTHLSIRVKHLAAPSKVAPDSLVYVVWIQPRNSVKQNVGAMTLNNNLEGSLSTVTAHRSFQLAVTPEPGGSIDQPSHEPVFTFEVERLY